MNCKTIKKVQLEQLHFPVDGYLYIVKTLTSVDGGKTFWYCGNSKYFKSKSEAMDYKKQQEEQEDKNNG